jgi:WD40 repeat protein
MYSATQFKQKILLLYFCIPLAITACGSTITIPIQTSTTAPTHVSGNDTLLLTYHGHAEKNTYAFWSPDGKKILSFGAIDEQSADTTSTLEVWDARTGQTLWTYTPTDAKTGFSPYSVIWSPNSQFIAASTDTHAATTKTGATVSVWDAQTGQIRWKKSYPFGIIPTAMIWSPNNKQIAINTGSQCCPGKLGVEIIDANTGASLAYNGKIQSTANIAWSPDSGSLASSQGQLWHITTNQMTTLPYTTQSVDSVAWSPDGKFLLIGTQDAQVLDIRSGKTVCAIHDSAAFPGFLAWSADGRYGLLVDTTSAEAFNATNCSIAYRHDNSQQMPMHIYSQLSAQWSPDTKFLAAIDSNSTTTVSIFTLASTKSTSYTLPVLPNNISWSPDSTMIASACQDGNIYVSRIAA